MSESQWWRCGNASRRRPMASKPASHHGQDQAQPHLLKLLPIWYPSTRHHMTNTTSKHRVRSTQAVDPGVSLSSLPTNEPGDSSGSRTARSLLQHRRRASPRATPQPEPAFPPSSHQLSGPL